MCMGKETYKATNTFPVLNIWKRCSQSTILLLTSLGETKALILRFVKTLQLNGLGMIAQNRRCCPVLHSCLNEYAIV